MSIRSSADLIRGRPAENRIYRQSFVRRVHQLIAAGHSRLEWTNLRDQEEPTITGLLVKEMRQYIESSRAPSWAATLAVHDDPPIEYAGKVGRARPRVDIEFERIQPGPRPRFQFEAKRLNRAESVGEYLGKDGMGSFLSGRYAAKHGEAGMLGYVQLQPAQTWIVKIQRRMEESRKALYLDMEGDIWQLRTDPWFENSYSSFHRRPGRPIRIHHIFLECS